MKSSFSAPLLLSLAMLIQASAAEAQSFKKKNQYTSIGVSLNAMNYFGDVVPEVSLSSLRRGATRANVGVGLTRRLGPRLSVRTALAYGRITGNDAKAADPTDANAKFRYHRNVNFRNDILELSAVGVYDLVVNQNSYHHRPKFVPYVFGGVAVFRHNPKSRVSGGTVPASLQQSTSYMELQPLRTEGQQHGYSLTQLALPFGGGIRYRVSDQLDVCLEMGWRKTFTDYLDDVSGNYTSEANLNSDAAWYFGHGITRTDDGNSFVNFNAPSSLRGRSNLQDWYIVTGITISYIMMPKQNGAKFR